MPRVESDFGSRLIPMMLAFAKSKGVPIEPLIAKYKLTAELALEQPGRAELVTPLTVLRALSEELAEALHDEAFGVTLAESVPKGAYGVAEFLIRSVSTLRQALENLVRFNALLAPSQTFRFEETQTEGQLHHYATASPGAMGRHMHECSSAIMVKAEFSMTDVPLARVWFCNPRPANTQHLVDFFKTQRLEFDQPTNGFSFERARLEAPVTSGDPALYSFLEEHAVSALASRPKLDELIDRLRHAIREALKAGEPNIERLSTRMHMSSRTLQRRLAELKTSFQDVLDEVRFDLARAYLRDARLDISQVAYLLGYSELRAFDRAFKRWAGRPPREWRQNPTD